MSHQSGFSTQSALFRLPSRANKFQTSQQELIESAKAKVESEKLLALERLQTFRDSLVKAIDSRINSYQKQLESEYSSFLEDYLKDMSELAKECEEYTQLDHPELDPSRPKVRFKEFEYFNKESGKVIKKERSQIVGYAENVELIEKKKKGPRSRADARRRARARLGGLLLAPRPHPPHPPPPPAAAAGTA